MLPLTADAARGNLASESCWNGSLHAWLMVVCIWWIHKIHAGSGCVAEAVSGAASHTQPLATALGPSTALERSWKLLPLIAILQGSPAKLTEWSIRAHQAVIQPAGWQSRRLVSASFSNCFSLPISHSSVSLLLIYVWFGKFNLLFRKGLLWCYLQSIFHLDSLFAWGFSYLALQALAYSAPGPTLLAHALTKQWDAVRFIAGWRAVNRFPCSHCALLSQSAMAPWAFFLTYQWALNHAGVQKQPREDFSIDLDCCVISQDLALSTDTK